MMLDYLGESKAAEAIRTGVAAALDSGARTADLYRDGYKKVSTTEMAPTHRRCHPSGAVERRRGGQRSVVANNF